MTAGIPLGSLFVDLVSLKKFNVKEIMNICAKEFSLNGQWVIYYLLLKYKYTQPSMYNSYVAGG